jgi:hypothetical protein
MSSKMDKINATAVIQSMPLPQPLTRLDVEKRQAEENRCEKQHRQILHRNTLSFRTRRDNPASVCRGPCSEMILRDGVLGWRKGFLKIK